MNQYITFKDYIILPFILLIIYWIFIRIRDRKYPAGHPWRKYFLPALTAKIVGGISIGLIYQYYYGGGDTFNYFSEARNINSALDDSFLKWLGLVFRAPTIYTPGFYKYISKSLWYMDDPATYYVCSITAVVSLFTFQTYLSSAAILAAISFTGLWALFRTFASIYPSLTKQVAICVLAIPSVMIWGSGIFKDTICIFGLGWMTYSVFELLVKRNVTFKNILLLGVSFLLVALIKVYILMAFLPALTMWILLTYSKKITSKAIRFAIIFVVMGATIGGTFFALNYLGKERLGKYSLDELEKTVVVTKNYIIEQSGEQSSAYDLGDFTNFSDMLLKFPAAVNVTLFRPYLWEASKIFIFVSALEAFLFLLITVKVIFSTGLSSILKSIFSDPNILFFLIFAILFAFSVGLTSGNFGTLSRYKIPCLPFYALAIVLIYYRKHPKGKPLFKILGL